MTVAPLIVTGMHRSGTSLAASLLADAGVDLGPDLLSADRNNRHGYFEDTSFLELDRHILQDITQPDDGGHRDWGWTESEILDLGRLDTHREKARDLARERRTADGAWGWKDPRTTVLLDFWDQVTGGARFVFVYRRPWDVADSMQRLGAEVFLRSPEYAYRIWHFYNRRLLDFRQRNGDRVVLVSAEALLHRPEELARLVKERLGVATGDIAPGRVDLDAMQVTPGDDPLTSLVAATSPECAQLLHQLEEEADLSSPDPWSPRPLSPPGPGGDRTPAVSVLTPCRDHGQLLIDAVASVHRCAADSELLIINDGSTQARTLDILEILREAGYTVIDRRPGGVAAARNAAATVARGRYLLPLDADNRLRPGFVEAAIQVLDERDDVGVVYGDRFDFGLRNGTRHVPAYDLDRITRGNYIDACAVLRREVLEEAGGYDPQVEPWSDWDLWVSAGLRGWKFQHLGLVAFDYRVRPNSLVTDTFDLERAGQYVRRMVEKRRGHYLRWIGDRIGSLMAWPLLMERELATLEDGLRQREDELVGLRERTADLEGSIAAASQAASRHLASSEHLQQRLLEMEAEINGLHAEAATQGEVERRLREELKSSRNATAMQREIAGSRLSELEAIRTTVATQHDHITRLRRELETARAAAARVSPLESDLSRCRELAASHETAAAACRETIDQLTEELQRAANDVAAARQEADAAIRRSAILEDEVKRRIRQLEEITSTRGWSLLSWYWRVAQAVKRRLGIDRPGGA